MAVTHANTPETFSFSQSSSTNIHENPLVQTKYIYFANWPNGNCRPHITILIFIHNCISETVFVLSNPRKRTRIVSSLSSIPRSCPSSSWFLETALTIAGRNIPGWSRTIRRSVTATEQSYFVCNRQSRCFHRRALSAERALTMQPREYYEI